MAALQRIKLGPFERYGEVLSGAFITIVGLVFLISRSCSTASGTGPIRHVNLG